MPRFRTSNRTSPWSAYGRIWGLSFISVLATAREIEGGGHNRVIGPDFQWRPGPSDSFEGQALWSESRTPTRPSLAAEWDGRTLSDRALLLHWLHNTRHVDWFLQGQDLGPNFRADDGFIPQVGYREGSFEAGYTTRPQKAFLSRVRFWTVDSYEAEPDGDLLSRRISAGSGMDGRWNSFFRVELNRDDIRVGEVALKRFRPRLYLEASPGRVLNVLSIDAYVGDEIDFDNAREGSGTTLSASATVRPSHHLELRVDASRRWLEVDAEEGSGRLFTARVERMRVTWSFNARSFVRVIGQYVQTKRDSSLYTFPVAPKDAAFSSSVLFAYKLNWQTLLYAGYGDDRVFDDASRKLEDSGRQAFAKLSYAWQW